MIATPPLELRLLSSRTGRDVLALAICCVLVALAINAVVAIGNALNAVLAARAVVAAMNADPGWYAGGPGAVVAGRWPWGPTVLSVIFGGGLVVTGLYGLRTGVTVVRSLLTNHDSRRARGGRR